MMRVFRVAMVLLVAGWYVAPVLAQAPAEALPSVDQVLDRYVAALGGKAAIEKITTRVAKGTFELPDQGVVGTYEAFAKAPNKSGSEIQFEGFGVVRQGFDGTVGWAESPQAGLREMAGQELSNTRRNAEFHQPLKLRELFPKMSVKERRQVGMRDAYVLEADPGDGSMRWMYFDAESSLLVQVENEWDTPQGRIKSEVLFEDYREVDGVKVAFVIRQSNPNIRFVIQLSDVRHNVEVDEAKFKKPASP